MSRVEKNHIDSKIKISSDAICRHIGNLDVLGRGAASQDILKNVRDLIEHIMLKIYAYPNDIESNYSNITEAIKFVRQRGDLRMIWKFHKLVQISVSHYANTEEESERLMLKYYEYLLRVKEFLKTEYSLDILENIKDFPVKMDPNLESYYTQIAEKIFENKKLKASSKPFSERFYIHKIKPFFIEHKIYYEVTFIPVKGYVSKFDRYIAFTDLDISRYYAVRLSVIPDSIEILGKAMPISIIVNWETSIRPCELKKFSGIFGLNHEIVSKSLEYKGLMKYLTRTGYNLVDILDLDDANYLAIKDQIIGPFLRPKIFDALDTSRSLLKSDGRGSNIIRYLLFNLNNRVVKKQIDCCENINLSNLYLSNKCIPFDEMPFCSSLVFHNPKLGDLFEALNSDNRQHELLARIIKNNTETKNILYTPIEDLVDFDDINQLIKKYNRKIWSGHNDRKMELFKNHVYIKGYESDTLYIIRKLNTLTDDGITNYSNSVEAWLAPKGVYNIDCDEKINVITQLFSNSKVALIYGAAGTGKSTLLNHIAHFNSRHRKIFLANTNPAVDNLKRCISSSECNFSTIASYIKKGRMEYDIVFVDECSTVSNRDMKTILEMTSFKLLVLVGDVHQIEAIRFGNWFSAVRNLIPEESVFELTQTHRTQNVKLREFWRKVRYMEKSVLEIMVKEKYTHSLDESVFLKDSDDEIVLCLNYDGLYGINNINKFLQQSNPNPSFIWNGIEEYKIGDPILFNESERFYPLIYNNMKGRIVGIEMRDKSKEIIFDIELDRVINGMDAAGHDFLLFESPESDKSVIRFTVNAPHDTDDDNDFTLSDVPFQVAYAVSIHKAQGLEYDSVKVVITGEVEELITHNIFYTAITRAKHRLKIYWTPEVENTVLSNIAPNRNGKDIELIKLRLNS